ncbi:MAG TPA: HDOD domain-containing protein [Verrucomicrobiae bacterium]|nr:HDOD domain-containing protein [Verrucomicrobiae bacterium]
MSDWRPSPQAEELVARVTELAAPAPTVVNLIGLLNRPDVDQAAVEQAVEHDPALSAKLLALANSAYFGLQRPVASLPEVLFYLGHAEVYRLAIAVSLSGILNRKASAYAMDEGELWRHSLLTAKVAELLADAVESAQLDESTAYTAGLLHDLGKIIFNQVLPIETQEALNRAIEKGSSSVVAERQLLGTDHAEAGACLLRQWNFPGPVVEAIASHERLRPGASFDLAALVYFANGIAHRAQKCSEAEAKALGSQAEELGLQRDLIEHSITRAAELQPLLEGLHAL